MLLETLLFPSVLLPFHEVQLRVTINQGHSTETLSRTWFRQSTRAGFREDLVRSSWGTGHSSPL